MGKHIKKWDRCFDKLKSDKGESGAAAICSSSIKNAGLKAKDQKRDKKDYYSNKKKADKVSEAFITKDDGELQTLIDDYYLNDNFDVIDDIEELTGLDFDQVITTLDISTYEDAVENLSENHTKKLIDDGISFNEDANATYPGPNLTNPISGQIVGSGSDAKMGTKQTEIEGGDDGVTSGGEYPLKYQSTVKGVPTRDTRQRKSAIKKLQKLHKMSASKVKMKSFADFNKDEDE